VQCSFVPYAVSEQLLCVAVLWTVISNQKELFQVPFQIWNFLNFLPYCFLVCVVIVALCVLFVYFSSGVWTQGLKHLGRCSTTWATPQALFCFSYFSNKILRFCLGQLQTMILHQYLPQTWDDRSMLPHSLTDWEAGLTNFLPGWPQTTILLILPPK
jgi:hypothetical protein